jgi:hypothetical protein
MALQFPCIQRVHTVESDADFFVRELGHIADIQDAKDVGRLVVHFPDLGETREWGTPVNHKKRHLWPRYSTDVFKDGTPFDLILIDGRFRVACALNALLQAKSDVRVLVHDFTIRPQYQPLLQFFTLEFSADTMVLLRPKQDYSIRKVQNELTRYQFLPEDKTLWFKVTHQFPVKLKQLFRPFFS